MRMEESLWLLAVPLGLLAACLSPVGQDVGSDGGEVEDGPRWPGPDASLPDAATDPSVPDTSVPLTGGADAATSDAAQ